MTRKPSKKQTLGDLYLGRPALLLGNGINLTGSGKSWKTLLKELVKTFDLDGRVDVKRNKNYPLTFEEILFSLPGSEFYNNLKKLRKRVASEVRTYDAGELHQVATSCGITEILTTNYDYAIERGRVPTFTGPSSPRSPREYKYSLRRRNSVDGITVWHINGEVDNGFGGKGLTRYPEESILIGNEHYADYLCKLHGTLKPPDSGQGLRSVLTRDEDLWARVFFTHDVHIIGLSLDYTEIHIWWLLNFRARLKRAGASIFNRIVFYVASFQQEHRQKAKLLTALEVEIESVAVREEGPEGYRSLYEKALAIAARRAG